MVANSKFDPKMSFKNCGPALKLPDNFLQVYCSVEVGSVSLSTKILAILKL